MKVLLKDIADIKAGQGAPQDDEDYSRNGIPFIKAGNLHQLLNGLDVNNLQKVSNDVASQYKLRLYPKGTILFAKSGMSCMKGYIYVLPCNAYVVNHLACIIPYGNYSDYLKYYLTYHKPSNLIKDNSYPSISLNDIGNQIIDFKTEKKQKTIVKQMKLLEQNISCLKKASKKYDDFIKARFIEMFGDLRTNNKNWQVVSFNECASIDTNMIRDFDGYEDYPHIGIDSIEKDTGRIFGYRTISEDGVISGKYLFTPKHIIYSKIRPNLNKVALPDFIGLCSADAYPILVKDTVCTREYFGYTLRSRIFLDYILAFSSRTNLPKVNKSQVEGFKLPLPPIELQNQFADFVQQVDKSREEVKRSLEKTQQLYDSLMQEYFG